MGVHVLYVMDDNSNANVWEEMSTGDLIQFDGPAATEGPHKVVSDEPAGPIRAVEGPGGASKMMTQNKHNPNHIYIMSMGDRSDSGSLMKNIRIVGSDG